MKGIRFGQAPSQKTVQLLCFAVEADLAVRFDHSANQVGAERCLHLQERQTALDFWRRRNVR